MQTPLEIPAQHALVQHVDALARRVILGVKSVNVVHVELVTLRDVRIVISTGIWHIWSSLVLHRRRVHHRSCGLLVRRVQAVVASVDVRIVWVDRLH